uniref:Uncharacterized protein n=1 Tax=Tetranychus urticae TaxID=32264 RepID=T1KYT6_TETUR
MSPQHSLVESSQSSATINHGELADNEEGGAASPEDSTGSGDYDYRANDLPDWMPPPPPPPPVSVPPPPSRPTSSSFLSSSPSSLQLGSFPGRTPAYPLPTHTSLFHVLPRHGPFAHRPLEPGASHQKDEFTLFLVILTIAGFFGLIISMFMPFILLLQSQQQSLGSGLGGLQPVYPLQPGLVQPAQLGTGAVVANGKRRRRKRNDNPTVISIMASLHDATMKFRDS